MKQKIPWQTLKKYRYPALILAVGVLLLLLPSGGARQEMTDGTEETQTVETFDLEEFTARAEALLSAVQGAGEVRLLLTLETLGRREYLMQEQHSQEQDRETLDTQAVLGRTGSGETPVTVECQTPRFRGAVVLSPGGKNPAVALQLKEALSSLTGLGLDKITVLQSQ